MKYGLKILEIDTVEIEKRSEFVLFDIDELNEFSILADNTEVDIKCIKEYIFNDLFKINTNKRIKVCSVLEIAKYIEQKITFIDSDFQICINGNLSSLELVIYGDLEDDDDAESYYDVFLYEQTNITFMEHSKIWKMKRHVFKIKKR